ncbi:hypothetical protein CC78DRAFT_622122 [Lojkania enalia]|uniref:AT hook domain-containing protein n=1 Tax=Lojkania enalia TaxID=147567 RepID=A0A9P4JVU5_9PLEO|nr:hypothetical protein CC78DRAFT_622122 [Didymosphaeria enalia]
MVLNDRQVRREQRMRGAGTTQIVGGGFGFNIPGAISSKPKQRTPQLQPAKQTFLPLSLGKTPDAPAGATNGSMKRHRSASLQRSADSSLKRVGAFLTPTQLGKRKRDSSRAQSAGEDDGEPDELSPEGAINGGSVKSIEKSRRVTTVTSPIQEDLGEQDELSLDGDDIIATGATRKVARHLSPGIQQTPIPGIFRTRLSTAASAERTPIAKTTSHMSVTRSQEIVRLGRNAKSSEPTPRTPVLPASQQRRGRSISATRLASDSVSQDQTESAEQSDDELSVLQSSVARIALQQLALSRSPPTSEALKDDGRVDELSSPAQPTPTNHAPAQRTPQSRPSGTIDVQERNDTLLKGHNRHKRHPIVQDEDDAEPVRVKLTIRKSKRTPRKTPGEALQAEGPEQVENVRPDEQFPEGGRQRQEPDETALSDVDAEVISSLEEESTENTAMENPEAEPAPRPAGARKSKPTKVSQHAQAEFQRPPPQKKPRHSSLSTQKITTMRLPGFAVKGVTAVDTSWHSISRLINSSALSHKEKKDNSRDRNRRRGIQRSLNHLLAFHDALENRFLNIQDLNGALALNTVKCRENKKVLSRLRNEYLELRDRREEVLVQKDDAVLQFQRDRDTFNERQDLSNNLFEIENAVNKGKDRAEREGRTDEGPWIPLGMLVEGVSRSIGGHREGNRWLDTVRGFNGLLESATGVLEGRV